MASQDSKSKVLVLSVGGTLGMRSGKDGPLKPGNLVEDLQKWVPELENYAEITVEIMADVDSSLMTPDMWLDLARRIVSAHDERECSGIVVLHGTDTMAYTASALSFLLPGIEMPVVLTGGQRPLAETRTDARNNIIGAVETALEGPVEVSVFFNNHTYRGNRVIKAAIGDFDGFESPNFPPLGKAGMLWEWNRAAFWPTTQRPTIWPSIPDAMPTTPLVLPWTPGLDFSLLESAFSSQWAVILEGFGAGNMPLSQALCDFLKPYIDDGGMVFMKSQVPRGRVIQEAYEPGKAIQELGIIGCGDMTREAVITKLMTLKAQGVNPARLRNSITQSLAGELTVG